MGKKRAKTSLVNRRSPVTPRAGDVYRAPRPGRPARFVKVTRVNRSDVKIPTVSVVELTRTGTLRRGGFRGTLSLTWSDGAWGMRPGFVPHVFEK